MSARRPRGITVVSVGTPPTLPLRPLVLELQLVLEAKQAAERQARRGKRHRDDRGNQFDGDDHGAIAIGLRKVIAWTDITRDPTRFRFDGR